MSCMKKGLGPRGDKETVKEKGRWRLGVGGDRGRGERSDENNMETFGMSMTVFPSISGRKQINLLPISLCPKAS